MSDWIPLARRRYLKSIQLKTYPGQDLQEVLELIRAKLRSVADTGSISPDTYYDQLCEDAIKYKMRKK